MKASPLHRACAKCSPCIRRVNYPSMTTSRVLPPRAGKTVSSSALSVHFVGPLSTKTPFWTRLRGTPRAENTASHATIPPLNHSASQMSSSASSDAACADRRPSLHTKSTDGEPASAFINPRSKPVSNGGGGLSVRDNRKSTARVCQPRFNRGHQIRSFAAERTRRQRERRWNLQQRHVNRVLQRLASELARRAHVHNRRRPRQPQLMCLVQLHRAAQRGQPDCRRHR